MSRLEKFHAMESHPWFSRVYKKLGSADIDRAEAFIAENNHLGINDFDFAINRMFLDKVRPKNWKLILDLLANANVREAAK